MARSEQPQEGIMGKKKKDKDEKRKPQCIHGVSMKKRCVMCATHQPRSE